MEPNGGGARHGASLNDGDRFRPILPRGSSQGKEGDGSVAGEDGLIAPRREEEAVCCARSPPDPRAALEGCYIRAGRHCNDLGEESV